LRKACRFLALCPVFPSERPGAKEYAGADWLGEVPGAEEMEFRYAVAAGPGARSEARLEADTEPPPLETEGAAAPADDGQALVVNDCSEEEAVPRELVAKLL
jgi:hypothetical protein